MANVSKISDGTTTYDISDVTARNSIANLANVAASGEYSDLTNTPSIPNIVSLVSSSSTNNDGVGAKLFYDTVGVIKTTLHIINSGS